MMRTFTRTKRPWFHHGGLLACSHQGW